MSAIPSIPIDAPKLQENVAANGAVNGASANGQTSAFKLLDRPIDGARPLKVIVIGAGYSGIYCGIRIPERLRNVDLTIYEKNAGLGGTWYENR